MFTIDNTPRKSSYLKKGLNKLRSSTRKSPAHSVRKSPAQTLLRRGQENQPSRNTAAGRAARIGSSSTPLVVAKGQGRSAKSPGLTASARKVSVRTHV